MEQLAVTRAETDNVEKGPFGEGFQEEDCSFFRRVDRSALHRATPVYDKHEVAPSFYISNGLVCSQ